MKTYLTYRFLIALFLLFSLNIFAQKKSNYSLLWKIEGKNLTKPSYLFGTMHVDDARAFNFSDAVLPAIKNCEKFALEVQPDSIALKITNNQPNKRAYLTYKKILSAKEFKQIAERFFLVNGYSIEESTQSDPNILISMLHPDKDREDDKTTFVDMHLLGHAKTMQKQIVGLEAIDDQLDFFEKLPLDEQRKLILQEVQFDINTYKKQLETLTKVYLSGDINEIEKMVFKYGSYDKELESRNKIMCESIIKEMKNSSLFSAVGAAHLPGDIGLIKLLKDHGYKVTAVEANFTGVANTFKIDPLRMKWHKFVDASMGYSVETPGIVSVDSSYTDFNLNAYPDLISKKYYTFFTLDLREKLTKKNKEAFYKKIINNTSNKYDAKIISSKKITIDGVSGYELIMKQNTTNTTSPFNGIRSIYLINNGIFYQFFVLDDIEKIKNKAIDRFFNSVKFTEPESQKTRKWFNYYNENGAFSINLPTDPKESTQKIDNPFEENGEPYKLNLYLSSDIDKENNYLFRYNDLPTGYYIDNLEDSFSLMEKNLLSKSNALLSSKKITLNGYEGREYELLLQNNYHAVCKVFFRGNRTYLLLSQKINKEKKTDPNNTFFKSFKFEDYKNDAILITKTHNNFDFKTLKDNRMIKDSLNFSDSYYKNSVGYFSKNTKNGDVYSIEFSELKHYFKINSLTDFYELNKDNLVNWNDSIIAKKKIKIGQNDALEIHKINKKDRIESRYIMWLDHNYFFLNSAYTSKETINSSLTDSILKSYKRNKRVKTIDYFSSKTDHIINDLKSKDSATFNHALGAFNYYEFEESDLKKLYKVVNTKHFNDKNNTLVTEAVLNILKEINNDKTLDFLKTLYLKPNLSENAKRTILYIIPNLKNDNRLDVYKELLFKHTPNENNEHDYALFKPLKDSVPFAITNYNSLIKLIDKKEFRRNILEISSLILKSKAQNSMYILSKLNAISGYATQDLESYLLMLEKNDYDYSLHSLIDSYLFLFYNTPITTNDAHIDTFTKQLTRPNINKRITLNALKARLKHRLKIDASIKKLYLDQLDTRFSLMKIYHQVNKLKDVPSTYLKPEKFSKLSLNEFLNDNSEQPNEVRLLKKIIQKNQLFYVYALVYENSDSEKERASYLTIVGPCKKIKQEYSFKRYKVHTNWELIEENWEKQAINLIPQLNEIVSD